MEMLQKKIQQEVDIFLKTSEGKNMVKKRVRSLIKDYLEDANLEALLGVKNEIALYKKISYYCLESLGLN